MNRRALVISAALTLLGSAVLVAYVRKLERSVRGGPTTAVLVLLEDTSPGTALTRQRLGARELPQSYLESRHVEARAIDQVVGLSLAVEAKANETLLWTDLASMRRPERQLSKLVPEGMRAFTLAASASPTQLLTPGDRVDVLLVPESGTATATRASAMLAAQNVLVLAIGDDLGHPAARTERGTTRAGHATLSVTVAQSKALAEAERRGSLRLVLRNPDDITISDEIASPSPGQEARE
jgi:pilus assembly protein CpaB